MESHTSRIQANSVVKTRPNLSSLKQTIAKPDISVITNLIDVSDSDEETNEAIRKHELV